MNNQNDKPTIIFDFDGTLADTLYKIIEIINRDPKRYDIDGIDPLEVDKIRNNSIIYYLKELKLHIFQVYKLIKKIQLDLGNEIDEIATFEELKDVLKKLKKKGYLLGVYTNNSKSNVQRFIRNHDIEVFDFIMSEKSLLGKHRGLKRIAKKYKIDKQNLYYIGDEVRDIEAAHRAGVKSIAVTWGFNTESILKKESPDYIVHKPQSLLDIFS